MQQPSPIKYSVSIPNIANHQFHILLNITSPTNKGQILTLPTWIPGSYMVRDFAKNILWLTAKTAQGEELNVTKLDKQSWQIAPHTGPIQVEYSVYALDLSVRSAFLDTQFGFANGTSLFLEVKEQRHVPVDVEINLPDNMPNWTLATTLPKVGTQPNKQLIGRCENYLDLIEYPLLFGELDIIPFSAQGVNFELVFVGGHNADRERLAKDLSKIADHHLSLFDSDTPITHYQFLTILTESDFGGLEHTSSTALVYSRDELPTVAQRNMMFPGYRTFLSLCSHELFHTWHVKRTKPACLIDPDLSQEVYTEQLWIYEGFTSYYDDFSLQRAGVISNASYLEVVGQNLTRLLRNAGRFNQTVTESSFDAWTKFYKQDENAANAIVSYYVKGGIIAMCLDLKLRLESQGNHSLDDIMRMLWEQYGAKGIGTPDNIIHQLLNQLGYRFDEFLHSALYTTEELPTESLLNAFGVSVNKRSRAGVKDQGGRKMQGTKVAFGANFKGSATGIEITQVFTGTPAEKARLTKGDNIIALNGVKVSDAKFQAELDKLPLSDNEARLHYFRRGCLEETRLPLTAPDEDTVYLEITDKTLAQHWLGIFPENKTQETRAKD
ncbi:M61 family metallopeptidase [Alteromonas sp. a30]|uniref:M61 family metallopeptidase n=1 Tax=Alteromonas sp. a30 TaxID=2730917 RepID=UPI00228135D4|nr:PDZ domain-containing protein [Alteromonas sp. a30]MCY7294150.1 M61 family metallopeptidase [Alteromonas sp. a30]